MSTNFFNLNAYVRDIKSYNFKTYKNKRSYEKWHLITLKKSFFIKIISHTFSLIKKYRMTL